MTRNEEIKNFIATVKLTATNRTPEQRAQLLIDAKILTEDGNYHPDFFSEETIAGRKPITLSPRKYKVEQDYNDYVYFIEWYNVRDGFRWYVKYGHEVFPQFFSGYIDFKNGFDTPESAIAQLEIYLKSSFPIIRGKNEFTN